MSFLEWFILFYLLGLGTASLGYLIYWYWLEKRHEAAIEREDLP